ncbi:LOW QUALITY PROTEIN: hypothetical protein NC652_018254 [Populus alba x Populus x berolinensis]|nr:LOW QUALITY PROTEIN: hypothetical protein NC652_018254 [Populus alba x Populus x berolinensis]
MDKLGYMDEEKLRILLELRVELETKLAEYKEGRAPGAGVAFVIFKDVYTAKQAVQDFCNEKKRRFGKFFSVMELRLQRNHGKLNELHWRQIFTGTISGRHRLSMREDAMNKAQSWLDLIQSFQLVKQSLIFQFLPNVIIFVSIVYNNSISSFSSVQVLNCLRSKRAALLKMVCFFLVNLYSIERSCRVFFREVQSLIMGVIWMEEDMQEGLGAIHECIISVRNLCLSSLAFLITTGALSNRERYPLEGQAIEALQRPLIPDNAVDSPSGTSPIPKQTFDFAQYYAFNLTIFALTLIYSSFAPLVVPVGAVCGWTNTTFCLYIETVVFPAGNEGRLMAYCICVIMRFCVDLFLLSMLLFFSVQVLYKLLPSDNDSFKPSSFETYNKNVDSIVEGPIDLGGILTTQIITRHRLLKDPY